MNKEVYEWSYDGACAPGNSYASSITFSVAGDGSYGGDFRFYLLVEGDNLKEILENEEAFRNRLQNFGIQLTQEDLGVISDLHIW